MTVTDAAPSRRSRVVGGGVLAAAIVALALVGATVAVGGAATRDPLDPESVGPDGTRAVARILSEQGVDVRVVRDRAAAQEALGTGGATLVLADPVTLSDATVRGLTAPAAAVVLLEPRARTLGMLLAGSAPAGAFADAELSPQCPVTAARTAGRARLGELYTPGAGVTGCYPGDGGYGLLTMREGARAISAVDGRMLLANDALTESGNAALAISLLGGHPRLVWYVPSPADADAAAPSLGELTPPWVSPVIVLLLAAGLAAGIWRGRRFGPLVTETLPVTVRAAETTVGRGRLYARSGDAAHAAEQLRRAAVARMGRALGLGPRTPAATVADAVAGRTGRDRGATRALLGEQTPATDRELVEFTRRLRELEAALATAIRPHKESP